MAKTKFNFKYRPRKGVKCPRVQVDVLSYEPLSKRIERFLSGDASSLEGADTTHNEYDEPEKAGEDSSVFEPGDVRDDPLNQPLDNLDIAELRCDTDKVLIESSKKIKSDQAKSDQAKSDQAKSDQAKFDQAKFDQAKFDQAKFDQAKFDQAKFDQANKE